MSSTWGGTRLFSRLLLGKYPRGQFLLVDVAEKMLYVAREQFRDQPGRVQLPG